MLFCYLSRIIDVYFRLQLSAQLSAQLVHFELNEFLCPQNGSIFSLYCKSL